MVLLMGSSLALAQGCVHAQSGREVPSSLLQITSDTADADVWVDGQYIGQVAAVSGRLKLAAGVHRVEIRKPGHFPVQRTVRVDKNGGGAVIVEAELLADPR
jgi:PEGA domain